jgi:acetyl esterase/lipase
MSSTSESILRAPGFLDPEMLETTVAVAGMLETLPALSDETLAEFRSAMAQWARPVSDSVPVERTVIAHHEGADLAVYVINGRPGTSRPAVLHMHGGGFVGGAARFDLRNLQDIAAALDIVCVSVDYRLAPETRWIGSLADNYTALRWLHTNAGGLGADPERIAVMGESAGGCHAALLAKEARDRGEVPLVLQLLVYPALDDRTGSSHCSPRHIGTMFWPCESNQFGWSSFLGVEPGGSAVSLDAVPARLSDLAGLPPAFIAVGALDLFVAEGIEYARRLISAGVSTELHVLPGAVHGFDEISPDASLTKQFFEQKLSALRRAFGIPPG